MNNSTLHASWHIVQYFSPAEHLAIAKKMHIPRKNDFRDQHESEKSLLRHLAAYCA